jgi:hypothetical protein
MTKQSRIRKSHFIGIEPEGEHAAPQQVIGMAARVRAKTGVRHSWIMREVFQLAGAETSSFEQLIGPTRHPAPPQLHKHVR